MFGVNQEGSRGEGAPRARTSTETQSQKPAAIAGGYKLIPVRELAAVWYLQDTGQLRIADVRAYMACHEANARRCTVGLGTPAKFTLAEILRLTGGTERHLKASIARLEAAGVLVFTESAITFARELPASSLPPEKFAAYLACFPNHKRLLPVPRRILRLMAGGARRSLIATIVGHLLWGLYRWPGRPGEGKAGQGGFDPTGRVKCSWIAETFGIDLRRVKQARKELIELGWLVSEEAGQWEHNRWGAKFRINLAWSRNDGQARAAEPAPVVRPELPPPPAEKCRVLPPPVSDKKLPTGSKNQKPASGGPAGFQSSQTKDRQTPDGRAAQGRADPAEHRPRGPPRAGAPLRAPRPGRRLRTRRVERERPAEVLRRGGACSGYRYDEPLRAVLAAGPLEALALPDPGRRGRGEPPSQGVPLRRSRALRRRFPRCPASEGGWARRCHARCYRMTRGSSAT